MKKFCINILVVLTTAIIILLVLTWYNANALNRSDWRLTADTHIIVIGPSTTGCALNEQHIIGFQNLSRDGTALAYLIPLLPRLLEDNPKIDTVLINHGRFQFKHMKKRKTHEGLQSLRSKIPFLFYDVTDRDWNDFLLNVNFYGAIFNPDFKQLYQNYPTIKDFGLAYIDIDRHNLRSEKADWGIAWYDSVMAEHGSNVYSKEWILENCQSTDYWSRKAIEICKQHNVVPVLFFTPLYQYDRWCTRDGFSEYIKDYDESTLIADYEDFAFPDDSYYGDVHHLNHEGADYFTAYIAQHGLQVQTIRQWLAEKGYVLE